MNGLSFLCMYNSWNWTFWQILGTMFDLHVFVFSIFTANTAATLFKDMLQSIKFIFFWCCPRHEMKIKMSSSPDEMFIFALLWLIFSIYWYFMWIYIKFQIWWIKVQRILFSMNDRLFELDQVNFGFENMHCLFTFFNIHEIGLRLESNIEVCFI